MGYFCAISASALKNQLTAIPSPPVAEEKREHSGEGRELSEDSIWARSWKRRIQPRVGLEAVEPVLHSTLYDPFTLFYLADRPGIRVAEYCLVINQWPLPLWPRGDKKRSEAMLWVT